MTVSNPQNNAVQLVSPSIPSEHEMMVYNTMADQAVSSKMYRGIGEQAGVMMIMLAARELGVPPMQALNGGLNIIQGKVEISARMMNALIRKAGHMIKIVSSDSTKCILAGKRADTGEEQQASFTVEEAKQAGIFKPAGGWGKWPADMCYARALSRLARQLFPDVIGIGYVEGEIRSQEVKPEVELVTEDVDTDEKYNCMVKELSEDDKIKFNEYIDTVCKHFEWTRETCIERFAEDVKLMEKFDRWKRQCP